MSEDSEYWREYEHQQKIRRAKRLPVRVNEIMLLPDEYKIEKLTEFQFRINGVIDIYPIHHRWHNIKTKKRGDYKPNNLKQFLIKHKI